MNDKELFKRARAKQREIDILRTDPRYVKTIGTLVRAGLLTHNEIKPYRGFVTVEDALWAGQIEPRILELLPAVLLKRPRLFTKIGPLPSDLAGVLNDLRHGNPANDFRGIPPRSYGAWIKRVGRAGKSPSLLKTFRFNEEDLLVLETLSQLTHDTETDLVRRGLKLLLQSQRPPR